MRLAQVREIEQPGAALCFLVSTVAAVFVVVAYLRAIPLFPIYSIS
jgi:hypothetical protein